MKKFKTKKEINRIKLVLIIVFFLILFIIISFFKLKRSNSNLVLKLLNGFNYQTPYSIRFLTSNLDKLFNSYSFYQKDVAYLENKPVIYLYNTHDKECYADNSTIYEATKLLKNNLTKLGIKTIQEEAKTSELLHTGMKYYDISRSFIQNIIKKENNIAYFIDIHRDSVTDTTIKIKEKNYAKILFVLGLENKDYLKNKSIILKMNDYLNTNYPGLSKGIYEKKGDGVDGVYNQDIKENIILIEIGGVKNNIEEVNNSTEIISLMLYHMLGD